MFKEINGHLSSIKAEKIIFRVCSTCKSSPHKEQLALYFIKRNLNMYSQRTSLFEIKDIKWMWNLIQCSASGSKVTNVGNSKLILNSYLKNPAMPSFS